MQSPAPLVVAAAWAAGSVPVAQLVAGARGSDLGTVGTGTISGSGLYAVAGFGPLALAGCVELAKGALGPLMAGPRRPVLGALAGAAAVAGHNWSPFLGLRGGRGVSLVIGAAAVLAPTGAAAVLAGLVLGRAVRETGLGTLAGLVLVPVAMRRHGRRGALAGCGLLAPVLLKRLVGNDVHAPRPLPVLVGRLLGDRDDWLAAVTARVRHRGRVTGQGRVGVGRR